MIDSDHRPDSNQCPLKSLSQIMVQFKGILKQNRAYLRDIIGRRFEKVRNGHRFGNRTSIRVLHR